MYDVRKRRPFTTAGELTELLTSLPPDQKIFVCGQTGGYFHADSDMSVVCIDADELDEEYEEE